MRRYLIRLLILSVLCLIVAPLWPVAAEGEWNVTVTQVDNSAYPIVTIYVRVEKNGSLVENLPQTEFTVKEDGQPVAIVSFNPGVHDGIKTLLTMDRSVSMRNQNKMRGAKDAAKAYVQLIRAQDQAALIAFDQRTEVVQPFTPDKSLLSNQIESLQPGACTALYDAVYQSAELIKGQTGRRTVILITDGIDCHEVPAASDRGSQHSLAESLQAARQADVPMHVIGLGNRTSSDVNDRIDENTLRRIADETRGTYYYAPTATDLEALYRLLATGAQKEYVITYRSPRAIDGTRRDIRVEVGSSSGSQAYLEQHLLNIQSNALVGGACLLPLLALLLVPVGARYNRRKQPAPAMPTSPVIQQQVNQRPTPQPVSFPCPNCGTPLRTGARFCNRCGQSTTMASPPTAGVCRYCGSALRAGAKFCAKCGRGQK